MYRIIFIKNILDSLGLSWVYYRIKIEKNLPQKIIICHFWVRDPKSQVLKNWKKLNAWDFGIPNPKVTPMVNAQFCITPFHFRKKNLHIFFKILILSWNIKFHLSIPSNLFKHGDLLLISRLQSKIIKLIQDSETIFFFFRLEFNNPIPITKLNRIFIFF